MRARSTTLAQQHDQPTCLYRFAVSLWGMKCLVVSDIHYDLKQYDWVLNQAAAYDIVVLAGDHLDISSTVDIRSQITVIQAYMRRIAAKTRLLVCSGNHDLDARNSAGEKYARWIQRVRHFGVPTDTDSLKLGDTLFTICPWWDGPESCREIAPLFERDDPVDKERWIWLYHAPPSTSPTSWNGRQHFGDDQLLAWIEQYQPDIVLTGHIHQSPFKKDGSWVDRIGKTWIFNAGRHSGPMPCHIVINTQEEEAVWLSLSGAETVNLDQPLTRPLRELTALPSWLS
jgi:Icc-related predicted phosphoesterase